MSEAVEFNTEKSVDDAYAMPLADIDVSQPALFRADAMWPYFDRLRKEAPIHFCPESQFGPYWSVTKYKDIMHVDTHHNIFSSESAYGGISIRDGEKEMPAKSFIAADPPVHDEQRLTVSPVVAPDNLMKLEPIIRARLGEILDNLPRNETFDWVDNVSIELTTQMLAILFDFPWDERRKLTRWSDVATADVNSDTITSMAARRAELQECADYFSVLWNERLNKEPGNDLLSLMAHSPATRNMDPNEFLGNLILLIVGGNDTTRNSISGGLYALNLFPDQYKKLQADPALIPNMVPEIIRWQTPLAHMRRTATQDTELGGKKIKKGDKVIMWYVSGNRDDEMIDNPYDFIIDRPRPRQHLSFGFGIHRCVGNRVAEMQLRIVWEEILKRFETIEVVGEPRRVLSSFVKGYEYLPVRIPS